MPTLVAPSFLAANLTCLGERNADVAEKLATVEPHPGAIFAETSQGGGEGVPAATLDGKPLCSRHRPLEEAARLVRDIDLVEHAVVVVLGFGLGYHVQKLIERSRGATVIVVYEPDLSLLRAVFEQVDHSAWLRNALVVFVTDPNDRGSLAKKLEGAESILAQGVHFLEHPSSRARLSTSVSQFTKVFSDFITAARTTLTTTLMRSVDTVRNLMLNIDHYAAGAGISDLHNIAAGRLAVVVSAGPSLHKNMHLLRNPGVRERCVIIAVQTTLKPLLAAGIRPHFVTALDYHEISSRFYEDLNADDLHEVTLIADPKANPVILDVYPGPIRCCANPYLDKLLGSNARDMGTIPAGATVAHLAVYFAKFFGCNPIAMIGQDLGFPDGLYYAPGTAIHDVWAPELNPFNTIEMMEWQRIVRHRTHLVKVKDVHGKSIYTDAQMHTYLQQFERDFAQYKREGLTIIDATEGGVAKQNTIAMPLGEVLTNHSKSPLPPFPLPSRGLDNKRLNAVRDRLANVRVEVRQLREVSEHTVKLLRQMINDQRDQQKMGGHFAQVEKNRKIVEQKFAAFEMLNFMNQLGVFRRMKADRRLHMQSDLDPLAKQRAQLDRDLENVQWIADAATEMIGQLESSGRSLAGKNPKPRTKPAADLLNSSDAHSKAPSTRIAALVPIDPERNGLGIKRSLAEHFGGNTVLQATLERLGQSQFCESIILMAPKDCDIESMIDRARIRLPVEIEHCDDSPFGPEHEAIAVARLWADTCWRGGIAGMSIYDEVLCPQIMHQIMQRRGLTAALIAGPDWPLINVIREGGCDALIRRHLEHPPQHNLVFTQSPPGMCGCVISATLMSELSQRNRLATIGGLLVYQPHAPQGDPIAREACVQIDHQVRNSLVRATFDSPRQRTILNRAQQVNPSSTLEWTRGIAAFGLTAETNDLPRHLTLELCTNRTSVGVFARRFPSASRPPLDIELAKRIIGELGESADSVLTLAGLGDPLLHPEFDEIIRFAKQSSIYGVHVRTEILCESAILDRLLASGVDVVSVEVNADRAATYQVMMGVDRFKNVLMNLEHLINNRRKLTPQQGTAAIGLPWIVPTILRCAETYEDIDSFFDRWQHLLGVAVIEGLPSGPMADSLTPTVTPQHVLERDCRRQMTILSDGSAPVDHGDLQPSSIVGNVSDLTIRALWKLALTAREGASVRREHHLR